MSKQITVKYFQESVFAKEPIKATEEAAGYDLFAAEAKIKTDTEITAEEGIICIDNKVIVKEKVKIK